MAGVVPPLDTTGDVPVTEVTPPGDPLAAAVIKPLALTVMLAFVNAPTLLLTVARVDALPTEVTSPVKLALVVTLLAVNAVAVPVMFVPTKADGVPKLGVTRVGLFDNTTLVVPVLVVTPVPPLRTGNAVPDKAIAKVPLVVMGEPVTDKNAGTVAATLVTVPDPPLALIV